MFFILFHYIKDSAYLFRSYYSKVDKIRFFLIYSFLTLSLPFCEFFKIKKINILGFKIEAFNFHTLQFLFGEIFVRGEYYFKTDNKDPVIIDCGSNIGFSVIYFKYFYPDSIIYCFEPDPNTFEVLKKNVEQNRLLDVHVYNKAISDRDGESSFYVDDLPGNMTMSLLNDRLSQKEIKVKTISLSNFVKEKNIDFLKMDIEGYENVIVEDLAKTNSLSRIKEAAIEYHHLISNHKSALGNFLGLLEEAGFEYKIDTMSVPIGSKNKFQDILVYAYRN